MSILKLNQFKCFCLLWLCYAVTYFLRKPLGVVKTVLGGELGLSMNQLGWLDSALILPYASIQIGLPGLSDKFGAKRVLFVCLVGAAASSYFCSLSWDFFSLSFPLIITGCFLAPCWPACSKLLASWFPDSGLNVVFGLINTATYTGGLGGTALATALMQYSGWRLVYLPPAVMSLVAACLLLFLKTPQELKIVVPGKTEPDPTLEDTRANRSAASLFKIPAIKELCVCMFCLKFVRYVMYLWLPMYLVEHLGYSNLQAGMFSTIFDIGGIIGSPLLGIILDKVCPGSPLKGISVALVLGTLSLVLFISTASFGLLVNGIFLFLTGSTNCGPDSLIAGSISMDIGERVSGGQGAGVTSLVNGVGNVGGMVEGPVVGAVWSWIGWSGVLPGVVAVNFVGLISCCRAYRVEEVQRRVQGLPS